MDLPSLDTLGYFTAADFQSSNEYLPASASNRADQSIDRLLGEKHRILKVKLEVLASEIFQRLEIRKQNLDRLLNDELILSNVLLYFEPSSSRAPYRPAFPEKLYQEKLDLGKQRREQDVECWRDVVMVMRDFLSVWEAVELARSKASFLGDDRESD